MTRFSIRFLICNRRQFECISIEFYRKIRYGIDKWHGQLAKGCRFTTSQQSGAIQNCTDMRAREIASETGALGGGGTHTHRRERADERGGVRSGDACFENSLLRALGRVGRARQALTSSKNVVVSHPKPSILIWWGKNLRREERRKTFAAFCYPGIKCSPPRLVCASRRLRFHGFFFVSRVCVCVCGRRWLCVVILERPCCRAISNCTTIPQPRRLTS